MYGVLVTINLYGVGEIWMRRIIVIVFEIVIDNVFLVGRRAGGKAGR